MSTSRNKRLFKTERTTLKAESISLSPSPDPPSMPSTSSSSKKFKEGTSHIPKAETKDDVFAISDDSVSPVPPPARLLKKAKRIPSLVAKAEKLSPSPSSKADLWEVSDDPFSPPARSSKKVIKAPKDEQDDSPEPEDKVKEGSEDEEDESSKLDNKAIIRRRGSAKNLRQSLRGLPADASSLTQGSSMGLNDLQILDIMSDFVALQDNAGLPPVENNSQIARTERWWDEILTGAMIRASSTENIGNLIMNMVSRIVALPRAKAQAKKLLTRAVTSSFKQVFGVKKWDKDYMLKAVSKLHGEATYNAKHGNGTYLSAHDNGEELDVVHDHVDYDVALSGGSTMDSFMERFQYHEVHTKSRARDRERYEVAASCSNRRHIIVSDLSYIQTNSPAGPALVYQCLTKLQELAEVAFFRSSRDKTLLEFIDAIRPGDMPQYPGILGLNVKNPLKEYNQGLWSVDELRDLKQYINTKTVSMEKKTEIQAELLVKHGTLRSVGAIKDKLRVLRNQSAASETDPDSYEPLYDFALRSYQKLSFKVAEYDAMLHVIRQALKGSHKIRSKNDLAELMSASLFLNGYERSAKSVTSKMDQVGIRFNSWDSITRAPNLKAAKAVLNGEKMRLLGRTPEGDLLPREDIEDSLYPEERMILTQQFRAFCEDSSYNAKFAVPTKGLALECQSLAKARWRKLGLQVRPLTMAEWNVICSLWAVDDDCFPAKVRQAIHKDWRAEQGVLVEDSDESPAGALNDNDSDIEKAAIETAEARQSERRATVANNMRKWRARQALGIGKAGKPGKTLRASHRSGEKSKQRRGRSGSFLADDSEVDEFAASDFDNETDRALESDSYEDSGKPTPAREHRTRKHNSAPLKLDPRDGDIGESSDSDFKLIKAKPKQHWRDRVKTLDSKRDVSPKSESDNEQVPVAFRSKTKVKDDSDSVSRVIKHENRSSDSRRRSKQTSQQPLGGVISQKRAHSTLFAKSEDSDFQAERPEPDIIDLTSSPPASKSRKLFSRKTNGPASYKHQSSSNDGSGRNYPQSSTSASFTPRSRLQASRSSYSYESLEDMEEAKAIERARQY